MHAELWDQVEFDEHTMTLCIEKRKRVDAKSLHHPEASWDASVGHDPT